METLSELQRENRELNDRKELLELRQENRDLKRQIKRLESGKTSKRTGAFGVLVPSTRIQWIGLLACVFFTVSWAYAIIVK